MTSPLLIVGASVRAAAQSALRAGFTPLAIDMFGDVDLQRIAQTRRCNLYPDEIPTLASELPDAPFLYTGALENSPQILAALQSKRTIWGNSAETLQFVRDPLWVQQVVSIAGSPSVPTSCKPPHARDRARWLRKPLSSAAGLGIEFESTPAGRSQVYWQQFVPGVPYSAVYLADDRQCRLIRVARQWVGLADFPVSQFQFCGAVTSSQFSAPIQDVFARVGSLLTELAQLKGLFGIDFIVQDELVYVVEVNPRPTATLELYERLLDRSLLQDHANVFRGIGSLPISFSEPTRTTAKLILYAPEAGRTPHLDFWDSLNLSSEFPLVADLPEPSQSFSKGQPICTILADGETESQAIESILLTTELIAREMGWRNEIVRSLKGLKLG